MCIRTWKDITEEMRGSSTFGPVPGPQGLSDREARLEVPHLHRVASGEEQGRCRFTSPIQQVNP